ncbi:hypothetical protein [Halomonas ventosae]|uniref:hypothetical protein n=1 Tax=Halomonas ventosae TaxID=229007 RepID=UPI0011B1CDCD|nr:hypothetical protein [Halomonas ventosae]
MSKRWRSVSGNDVYAVLGFAEMYLKRHMKDPESFTVVERHGVQQNDDGYRVILTYRARNGFGGMRVESAIVHLDEEKRGRKIITLD